MLHLNNIKDFFTTKPIRVSAIILGTLLLASLIFHAGVVVGERRAIEGPRFNPFRDGQVVHPPFMPGFRVMLPHGFLSDGHGAVGVVQDVTGDMISILDPDDQQRLIRVSSTTSIRGDAPSPGARVMVLGRPDEDGSIQADIIRVIGQ